MPDRDALQNEISSLIVPGFQTLQRFEDDRIETQYPELASLARRAGAGAGELAGGVADVIADGIDQLRDAALRHVAPTYFNLTPPSRPHKQRQAWAARTLGKHVRGVELSESSFRQTHRPALVAELADVLLGAAPAPATAPEATAPGGRAAASDDWPISRRPGNDQDLLILLATPRMRLGPRSPMIKLVRELEPYLRSARPLICAVEGTYNAIRRNQLLQDEDLLVRIPAGFQGGLVYATELVLQAHGRHRTTVVYILDPSDPTSLYPDTSALKRECLVKKTPYLTSYPGALRWFRLEWARLAEGQSARDRRAAGRYLLAPEVARASASRRSVQEQDRAVALAAHDRHKVEMLSFAATFEDLLFKEFAERYATLVTGHVLTGGDLDEEVMDDFGALDLDKDDREVEVGKMRDWQKSRHGESGPLGTQDWARLMTHGRHGGVTQLSRRILDGSCSTAIFFQDAESPREHDMEIRVLDRAAQLPTSDCLLLYDPQSAKRWGENLRECARTDRRFSATTLVDAYRDVFGVELVLAHRHEIDMPARGGRPSRAAVWEAVAGVAATYVREAMLCAISQRASADPPVRVGLSWGGAIRDVVSRLDPDPFATPDRLKVIPTVGVLGSSDRAVEAHAIVETLAQRAGGEAVNFSEYAFLRGSPLQSEVEASIEEDWRNLDLAVYACDAISNNLLQKVVGFPAELFHKFLEAEATEFGTIYLDASRPDVAPADYGAYRSTGASFDVVRSLADQRARSEVILVAGARQERERPAWAALRAGLASTFVTDPDFAWSVLGYELPALDQAAAAG